jgi:hypothetical protein
LKNLFHGAGPEPRDEEVLALATMVAHASRQVAYAAASGDAFWIRKAIATNRKLLSQVEALATVSTPKAMDIRTVVRRDDRIKTVDEKFHDAEFCNWEPSDRE